MRHLSAADQANRDSRNCLTRSSGTITIARKYTGLAKKYSREGNTLLSRVRAKPAPRLSPNQQPLSRIRLLRRTDPLRKERMMITNDGGSRMGPSRGRSLKALLVAAVAILTLLVGASISGAATGKKSAVDPTLDWAIATNPPSLFSAFYFGTEGSTMFSLTTHHILQPGVFGQPTTGPEAAVSSWKAVTPTRYVYKREAGDQVLRRHDDDGGGCRVLPQRPPRQEDRLEDVLVLQQRSVDRSEGQHRHGAAVQARLEVAVHSCRQPGHSSTRRPTTRRRVLRSARRAVFRSAPGRTSGSSTPRTPASCWSGTRSGRASSTRGTGSSSR